MFRTDCDRVGQVINRVWTGSAWEDDGNELGFGRRGRRERSVTQRQVVAKIYVVAQEAGGDARLRRVWYCNSRAKVWQLRQVWQGRA